MGLADRKVKQRIGADPRNLGWRDDSSKFGEKYLQSLGWTSGSGLGVSGEGPTRNLSIHHKLDLMGIGASKRGADDAGWKMSRQFDGLLARLNQTQSTSPSAEIQEEERDANSAEDVKRKKKDEISKKRKRPKSTIAEDGKASKRRKVGKTEKSGAEEEQKKEKKKNRKGSQEEKNYGDSLSSLAEESSAEETEIPDNQKSSLVVQTKNVTPRYRAHRARNIASKRLAVASTTSMNEILGISISEQKNGPSSIPFPLLPSSPARPSREEDGTEVPLNGMEISHGASNDADEISAMGLGARALFGGGIGSQKHKIVKASSTEATGDLVRNSGKSISEYFAEKLQARSAAKGTNECVNTKDKKPKGKRKKKEDKSY